MLDFEFKPDLFSYKGREFFLERLFGRGAVERGWGVDGGSTLLKIDDTFYVCYQRDMKNCAICPEKRCYFNTNPKPEEG